MMQALAISLGDAINIAMSVLILIYLVHKL